jgi:hypothetical protein
VQSFNKKDLAKKPEVAMSREFAQYNLEESVLSNGTHYNGSALDIKIDTAVMNQPYIESSSVEFELLEKQCEHRQSTQPSREVSIDRNS